MNDEPLKCVGTETVTINYQFYTYATRRIDYYAGKYDEGSQPASKTIYDFTENGITHTLHPPVIFVTNPNSYRYPNEYANLTAYTGDIKVVDILQDASDLQDTPPEILIESGIPEFLVTVNLPFEVTDTAGFLENKTLIYNKANKNNGVRINNQRLLPRQNLNRFEIDEIRVSDGFRVTGRRIENSYRGTVKNYSLDCDGGCPSGTCEVDCGDKMCCYGSDGEAVDFYYK